MDIFRSAMSGRYFDIVDKKKEIFLDFLKPLLLLFKLEFMFIALFEVIVTIATP